MFNKIEESCEKGVDSRGASSKFAAHSETHPNKMRTKALILITIVEIGKASGKERGLILGVAVTFKKNKR